MSRNRKGSEFLKGMGKAFEIFKALVDAILAAGGSDEDIARIKTNESLLDELVAVVMKYAKNGTVPIVDTIKPVVEAVCESFTSLLAACKQDGYLNSDFTEARWPLEPISADEDEYEVVEHHFAETLTVEEGLRRLAEMEKKGEIRLLKGSRLAMKYIAAHLDVQLNHPVILPLRAQHSDGDWVVPIFRRFWRDDDGRDLSLFGLGGVVDSVCGWLVLRKRPSVTG